MFRRHANTNEDLHPAVVGSAIYYLQHWTKINQVPPDKIGAKDNGNIAMAWEQTTPNMVIDVYADKQQADVLMQSPDGTITKKIDDQGSDAKALQTAVGILKAITDAAYEEEVGESEQEQPQPPEDITQAVYEGINAPQA